MSDEMIETASLYQEYDGAAFLVGTVENDESFCKVQENLQELQALVSSLGVPVCGQVIVNIRQYNPSLYIG